MYRILLLLTIVVAGCRGSEEVVATVSTEELTAQQLGAIMGGGREVPLSTVAVRTLANLWIDYVLVALAAAERDSLADSATVLRASWPAVQELIVSRHLALVSASRPPLADTLPPGAEVAQRMLSDSLYVDSLEIVSDITVRSDAAALVREAMTRLESMWESNRKLARYRGGSFTIGDFTRWVTADVNAANFAQLAASPDFTIERFIRRYALGKVLVQAARASEATLAPDQWEGIRNRYLSQLGFILLAMRVSQQQLSDSATTLEERRRLAVSRVYDYLRALATGERSLMEPLPYLSRELRRRSGARLRPAGFPRAVAHAIAVRRALGPEAGGGVEEQGETGEPPSGERDAHD